MGVLISDEYKRMNLELHANRKTYGASGHRWAERVRELRQDGDLILDYGSGKGTLAAALPDLVVYQYDPALGVDERVPCELVVCTDVLEHIEPEHLKAVLADIAKYMLRDGLLVVATRPANKTLPDGRNAHLIVKPMSWWLSELWEHFVVVKFEANELQEGEFTCLVRKK